jgi:hypothetical protein
MPSLFHCSKKPSPAQMHHQAMEYTQPWAESHISNTHITRKFTRGCNADGSHFTLKQKAEYKDFRTDKCDVTPPPSCATTSAFTHPAPPHSAVAAASQAHLEHLVASAAAVASPSPSRAPARIEYAPVSDRELLERLNPPPRGFVPCPSPPSVTRMEQRMGQRNLFL